MLKKTLCKCHFTIGNFKNYASSYLTWNKIIISELPTYSFLKIDNIRKFISVNVVLMYVFLEILQNKVDSKFQFVEFIIGIFGKYIFLNTSFITYLLTINSSTQPCSNYFFLYLKGGNIKPFSLNFRHKLQKI